MEPAEYVSVLTSAADSGEIALLVFNTGPEVDEEDPADPVALSNSHVVVVYGYTRNSDEWHPQAIPAYAQVGAPAAGHCPSSAWVDHFIIHDDNYGPYLALSSQALETHPNVKADTILIVRRISTEVHAHIAEAAAGIVLAQSTPLFMNDAPNQSVAQFPHALSQADGDAADPDDARGVWHAPFENRGA